MKRSEKGRPRLSTTRGPGKRVGPAEIESVLVESKKIVEAAVIGIPDEIKGQVPVAFVVPKPGADQGEEKVKKLMDENPELKKFFDSGFVIFLKRIGFF